ncbi:hypothetical protein CW751_06730 [Brumimicrobium salinarum]|uniref:O-antigen ligase-related domain-containing protein n=1 Tax=Brumimicrobium salinarum TaxID=2058658 RepID=A0A2I0R387_9FLAO|nr:O-antigen ligase family protein [Brumimicrobium salinarum]PKR80860.1 hypothetical protein CW751_06730 [Brumimicrobium salinarum]
MNLLKNKGLIYALIVLFIGLNAYFIYNDNYFFNLLPIILVIAYLGIYHTKTAFLIIAFLAPLSINLEEFTDGKIGLFLPTEPILFGLMVWIIFRELKHSIVNNSFWKHPIIYTLAFYLFWIFMSSITSSHPIVSFKFLLMKLWYIIPLIMIGFTTLNKKENVAKFLWCYAIGMTIVIIYTLIHHAGYNFREKEGHWVMSPFFKDHTSYGMSVAISLLFIIGLITYKKHNIQAQVILWTILVITLIGLYFSYTRGAWLSVVFAFVVWLLIKYRIKFKYLLTLGLSVLAVIFIFWSKIEMELERNKHEHTTTNFNERIRSVANISSDASNLERLNRWEAAWNMFLTRPVFGYGPGTYAFEYAPHQNPEKLTVISTNFGDQGNAHSEYLGPLSETGLIGMLSVIAFVSALFYSGIMLLIRLKRYFPAERGMYLLILSIVLALSTYFFHGLLNNYLDTDKAAVPIYGAAAFFIAQELKLRKRINALKLKEQTK